MHNGGGCSDCAWCATCAGSRGPPRGGTPGATGTGPASGSAPSAPPLRARGIHRAELVRGAAGGGSQRAAGGAAVGGPGLHLHGGVVENRRHGREQLGQVLEDFGPALVEEFIDGREFRVGVWGSRRPVALPPGEMDFEQFPEVQDRLCSYDAKFTPGSEHYERIIFRLPAPLTKIEGRLLERSAIGAHRAVGAPDYTRIDLRLRGGVAYVLDVNPNADIAADASTALWAQAAGIPYGAMLSRFVNLAAARHPRFAHQRRAPALPDRRPVQLPLA